MSSIPSKLVMLRALANVPVSEYSDIRPPNDATNANERLSFFKRLRQKPSAPQQKAIKSKQISFNTAVWLSFNRAIDKPVSVWLSYKDAVGENTILVDEQCLNGSTSAMFSGTVSFTAKGPIEYLRVCCGGISTDEYLCVDDACVKRQSHSVGTTDSVAA